MRYVYDRATDSLAMSFADGRRYRDSEEIHDGVVIDYDTAGRPIGIEFPDRASRYVATQGLAEGRWIEIVHPDLLASSARVTGAELRTRRRQLGMTQEQLAHHLETTGNTIGHARLYDHACDRACYRCLKSYRNQFDHGSLDKNLVRDVLFQLAHVESRGVPTPAPAATALEDARAWLELERGSEVRDAKQPQSPIEHALLEAIVRNGRLPAPEASPVSFAASRRAGSGGTRAACSS